MVGFGVKKLRVTSDGSCLRFILRRLSRLRRLLSSVWCLCRDLFLRSSLQSASREPSRVILPGCTYRDRRGGCDVPLASSRRRVAVLV